jgi:hypothetical protein
MGGIFLTPPSFYIFIYISFDPFIFIIKLNYLKDYSVIFLEYGWGRLKRKLGCQEYRHKV